MGLPGPCRHAWENLILILISSWPKNFFLLGRHFPLSLLLRLELEYPTSFSSSDDDASSFSSLSVSSSSSSSEVLSELLWKVRARKMRNVCARECFSPGTVICSATKAYLPPCILGSCVLHRELFLCCRPDTSTSTA